MTQTDIQRRLAPNGRISNLPPEMWDYVRTPEFKAWFGDWENHPEQASKILDENGEPLLLWHGSNRDFDRFDLSRGGENTGGGEWTDLRTGEKVMDDATKAMFFSSERAQAVSYVFLAEHHANERLQKAAGDLCPFFHSRPTAFFHIKNRRDFQEALDVLAAEDKVFVPLKKVFEENLGRKVVEIIRTMDPAEKDLWGARLSEYRERFRQRCAKMFNGGLSNAYRTFMCQKEVVDSLVADLPRLRKNDESVRNAFGTFKEYDYTVCGAGYDVLYLSFDHDYGRYVFNGEGRRFYLDEADQETLSWMCDTMRAYTDVGIREFNGELEEHGFERQANVYACFLNIRSPFSHDYEGSSMPDKYKKTNYSSAYIAARQVRKALADGSDGVVYRNIRDPFLSDSYGVFDAGQIRIVRHEHEVRHELMASGREHRDLYRMEDWFSSLPYAVQEKLLSSVLTDSQNTDGTIPALEWKRSLETGLRQAPEESKSKEAAAVFLSLPIPVMRVIERRGKEMEADLVGALLAKEKKIDAVVESQGSALEARERRRAELVAKDRERMGAYLDGVMNVSEKALSSTLSPK